MIHDGMGLHGQAKDRANWEASLQHRKELIRLGKRLGIRFKHDPHAMKLRELERFVYAVRDKRERWENERKLRNS
ncbi:hypothetical protein ACXYMX_00340 [Sporosarcina sp. CAU 1771]